MKAIRGTIARPDSGEKDISERQRRRARASVITVGDGRGFVVNGPQDTRLVVTAAHCLPFFPPADSASHLSERTYERLLAPLGTKPAIWAECLFVDPIADMAVLGSPDDQELSNEAGAYAELLQCATPISIAEAPREGHAWALSLECEWCRCSVKHIFDGPLLIFDAAQPLAGGMSGSPIISDKCKAIGVVISGRPNDGAAGPWLPNVRLFRSLPGWLLRSNRARTRKLFKEASRQLS